MIQVVHRPVPGYTDLYAGTDGSLVLSGVGMLKQHLNGKGYRQVYIPEAKTNIESHRLIAAAFLGIRPDGMETRHGEAGKLDNQPTNLCYGTHQQNMQDAIKAGRHAAVFHSAKTHCPQGHEYTPENTYLSTNGGYTKRYCRACKAELSRQREVIKKQRRAEKRSGHASFKEG